MRAKSKKGIRPVFIAITATVMATTAAIGLSLGLFSCLGDSHAETFSLYIQDANGLLRYDRVLLVVERSDPTLSDTLFDGHATTVEDFQGFRPKHWAGGSALIRLQGFQDTLPTYTQEFFFEDAAGPIVLTPEQMRLEHFVYAGSPHFFSGYAFSPKIAIRSDGIPFVAFVDASQENQVRVMRFDSLAQAWKLVKPEYLTPGTVGQIDLIKDAVGNLYLAYTDNQDSGRVTVLKGDAQSETWRILGTRGITSPWASELSLAIGPEGEPTLAYKDDSCEWKASVIKYNSSRNRWEAMGSPGFTEGEVLFLSLAISRKGVIYVAYYDELNAGKATVMRYHNEFKAWELVGDAGFTGGKAIGVLQIAKDETPYLAFSDGSQFHFSATVLKFNQGKSWESVGPVGLPSGQANHLDFSFNALGHAWLAYSDYDKDGKLTVLRKKAETGSWQSLGMPGLSLGTAWSLSLAMDEAGLPWVAFTEGPGHRVSVMRLLDGP